jgi:predicted ArsR family transcriptional regulator
LVPFRATALVETWHAVTQPASTAPGTGRDRVLRVLRDARGPLTVPGIVTASGLSANAVRFHVTRLLRQGVIDVAPAVGDRGPGRPATYYAALPEEAVDPTSAYRVLASLLGRELAHTGGTAAAVDAGRAWAGRVLNQLDGPAAGDGAPPDAVELVALLFARTGFRPSIDDDGVDDGATIRLHRCPFFDIAAEQPDVVCAVHRGLVMGLLEQVGSDRTVELTPVLDGSGPCVLRLAPPSRPSQTHPND